MLGRGKAETGAEAGEVLKKKPAVECGGCAKAKVGDGVWTSLMSMEAHSGGVLMESADVEATLGLEGKTLQVSTAGSMAG